PQGAPRRVTREVLSALARGPPTFRIHHSIVPQRAAVHRDLHSFPTRRSSDLESTSIFSNIGAWSMNVSYCESVQNPITRSTPARSEEHTSELQSRFDLVCRLLLEKKKTELGATVRATAPPLRDTLMATRRGRP